MPANRKKGFYTRRLPMKEEIVFCIQRIRTLNPFKKFKIKIKKSKTCSGGCSFLGISNGTSLRQFLSGGIIQKKALISFIWHPEPETQKAGQHIFPLRAKCTAMPRPFSTFTFVTEVGAPVLNFCQVLVLSYTNTGNGPFRQRRAND